MAVRYNFIWFFGRRNEKINEKKINTSKFGSPLNTMTTFYNDVGNVCSENMFRAK